MAYVYTQARIYMHINTYKRCCSQVYVYIYTIKDVEVSPSRQILAISSQRRLLQSRAAAKISASRLFAYLMSEKCQYQRQHTQNGKVRSLAFKCFTLLNFLLGVLFGLRSQLAPTTACGVDRLLIGFVIDGEEHQSACVCQNQRCIRLRVEQSV